MTTTAMSLTPSLPSSFQLASGEVPRGARALRVASMIAFIAALLGLENWACRGQTPTERSARPLRFTPGSGPIEGGRFVFIDRAEPAAAIGTASVAFQFAQHAASRG